MPAQSGFQTNTTIHAAFWRYIPDPKAQPPGKSIFVELNNLQFIESTPDQSKVWLYYAANNTTTSQQPYVLEGAVALAFLTDLGSLFI